MSYIYIHIPFCRKKCPYCDFISFANKNKIDDYIKLLKTEIALRRKDKTQQKAISCYFGGGTPSYLSSDRLNDILSTLRQFFYINQATEITVEANPSDLNPVYLSKLKSIGANRISIGIQSFNDSELEFLQRTHDAKKAKESILHAYKAGFNNISIDLMYGLSCQSKQRFIDNLKIAASLPVTHISIYSLSIEKGTLFYHRRKNGKITASDELSSEIYIDSVNFLKNNGFRHYEISNFAKDGYESIHNTNYWKEGEYWGFGLSASSYIKGNRIKNSENYSNYSEMLSHKRLPIESSEKLCREDKMSEEIILALRLIKGINWIKFKRKYDGLKKLSSLEKRITRWIELKMLKMKDGYLSLVFPDGVILSNEIFIDLL